MNAFVRPLQSRSVPARRAEPIGSESSLFLVGKNSRSNWVVQDQSGLCGGLFVGRDAARKFALSENGNRPEAVILVAGILELDLTTSPRLTSLHKVDAGTASARRINMRSRSSVTRPRAL